MAAPIIGGYTYVWEFHTTVEHQSAFENAYGPTGPWVQLFERSQGYVQTLLLQDRSNSLRYLTIDRWRSIEVYRAFRTQFSRQYEEIDLKCQLLTTSERALGEYCG